MLQVHMIWGSPLMVVAIMVLLYREIKWACFVGLAVMLLLVPVTGMIGKRLGMLRREIVGWTDKRASTMAEVVSGMRVIKFYDWEEPFKCALPLRVCHATSCSRSAVLCSRVRCASQ